MKPRRLDTYTKTPIEKKDRSINYSRWLQSGETITSVIDVTVTASGFVDPAVTPLEVNDYQPNAAGDGITYRVEGGDDGETYEIVFTVGTSTGEVEQDMVVFKVRSLG